MIYALSLASNLEAEQNIGWAIEQLSSLGELTLSQFFDIPCRDGVGEGYINGACILKTKAYSKGQIITLLKDLEHQAGRVRPSHSVSLDIDLIAWQESETWQFNLKKMPLTFDVKLPLSEIMQHAELEIDQHEHMIYCIKPIIPMQHRV